MLIASLLSAGLASASAQLVTRVSSADVARSPERGTSVPVTRVGGTTAPWRAYSGFADSTRFVVRDAASWSAAWVRLHDAMRPIPPAPVFDWTRTMIAVVAAGAHPTGGVVVHVDSATSVDRTLLVWVTRSLPGRDCLVTDARSTPADVVALPRRDEPVRFVVRSRTESCE